jgi:hypothetical protein
MYAEYLLQAGSLLLDAPALPPLDPPPQAATARLTLRAPAARADPRRQICAPMEIPSIDALELRRSGYVSRAM